MIQSGCHQNSEELALGVSLGLRSERWTARVLDNRSCNNVDDARDHPFFIFESLGIDLSQSEGAGEIRVHVYYLEGESISGII